MELSKTGTKEQKKSKGYKEQEILGKNFEIFYAEEDREIGMPKKLITEAREMAKLFMKDGG